MYIVDCMASVLLEVLLARNWLKIAFWNVPVHHYASSENTQKIHAVCTEFCAEAFSSVFPFPDSCNRPPALQFFRTFRSAISNQFRALITSRNTLAIRVHKNSVCRFGYYPNQFRLFIDFYSNSKNMR